MSLYHQIIPFVLEHEYIADLKPQQAVQMYYDMYWKDEWDDLGLPLAACMLDTTVCHGPKLAESFLKNSTNHVTYLQNRLAHYKKTNEKSFMKRMTELRRFIDGQAQTN
jgi:lysozyme family protein